MERFDADDVDYVAFLQDQVKRLNAVLKEYQKRYLPIREPEDQIDETAPPWLVDKSILTPLLLEYDESIRMLKSQVNYYKTEHEKIKASAERIIGENESLHEELRQSIERQLETLQGAEGETGFNQEALDNLHDQLALISKERESYKRMWEGCCEEVKEVQESLQLKARELLDKTSEIGSLQDDLHKARKYAENLQKMNNKLKQDQEDFLQSAQLHDREMETSREELRRCKTEIKTLKLKNEELMTHLERVQAQLKLLDQDSQRVAMVEKTSENTVRELQNAIVELESRIASFAKEVGKLRGEKAELEDTVATLQKRNLELEEKEYQATVHVRDSVQLVENALLEREQAVIREQQISQEVKRVKESFNALLKDAEKRKNDEIETLKAQHQQEVDRLNEEMHYVETEGAEKQAQLERVIREKSSVERELERLYQEGPAEMSRAGITYEELQKKVLRSEIARDELQIEIEQLRSGQRKSEAQHANDVDLLKSQIEESSRRIKALQEEVENTSNSRMILLDEIDKLKRNLDSAMLAKKDSELKAASEVACLEQQIEMKERDFVSRARATDEMSRKTISELREMLTAQQRVGTKWREESKTMTHKYDRALNEMSIEIERLRKKNEEMGKRLEEEAERCDQLEQELYSQKASQERLQRISADADARADAASAQVQTLLNRERQLLQERKELSLEVDRLKLESARHNMRSRGANRLWTDDNIEDRA